MKSENELLRVTVEDLRKRVLSNTTDIEALKEGIMKMQNIYDFKLKFPCNQFGRKNCVKRQSKLPYEQIS